MRHHLALVLALLPVVPVANAQAAGDPIMPLSDVRSGMHCTALSVIRGTDVASFDADILDVVQGDPGADQPYILFKASGPAIDGTGIGPGFSGSPIYCLDAAGTSRVIGAISEGIGEYGNRTALATPIELILGEPVDPPKETRHAPALLRRARPLAAPLSVGGLVPGVAKLVQRAATKAHRVVYATPARPRAASFPVQTLRPGSAMAVGLAGGAFTAGAIGTVAYVDGDKVWSFGHPLDGAGRRSLLLQDAYVYSVINNPLASGDLTTYKFATAGHDVGTLTQDGTSAVVGRLGALPERFPLKITATDLDSGKVRHAQVTVADEAAIGLPTGINSLAQIGSIALTQMAYLTLGGLPLRQSGEMCVRFTIREAPKPMRFCNSYVGGTGGGEDSGGGPMVSDFQTAAAEFDTFNFGPVHMTGAEINLKLRRSLRLAYLLHIAKAPEVVHRGQDFKITLNIQRQNGAKATRTATVHVPKGMPIGERALTVTGTSADGGATSALDSLATVLDLSGDDGGDAPEEGVRTVDGIAKHIAALSREDGVNAAFVPLGQAPADPYSDDAGSESLSDAEETAQKPREILDDPDLRIAGLVKRKILVLP